MIFLVTVGPFLGWLLTLAMVFGVFWSIRKLFSLQFRYWRAGKLLERCPEWEALQTVQPPEGAVGLGPVKRRPVPGVLLALLGCLTLLGILALLSKALSTGDLFLLVSAVLLIAPLSLFGLFSYAFLAGQRWGLCPRCQKGVWTNIGRPCHICPFCGCVSIRQGDMLTPEETIRAMPRFRDLPKF